MEFWILFSLSRLLTCWRWRGLVPSTRRAATPFWLGEPSSKWRRYTSRTSWMIRRWHHWLFLRWLRLKLMIIKLMENIFAVSWPPVRAEQHRGEQHQLGECGKVGKLSFLRLHECRDKQLLTPTSVMVTFCDHHLFSSGASWAVHSSS